MNGKHRSLTFGKVLVPILNNCDPAATITAAKMIADRRNIILAGFVCLGPDDQLSAGSAMAQQVRKILYAHADSARYRPQVRVSHSPWDEILALAKKEKPDLLLLDCPGSLMSMGVTAEEIFSNPPCDIALVRGMITAPPKNILVPLRGGAYAEMALRISLAIAHSQSSKITSLHIRPPQLDKNELQPFAEDPDAPYRSLSWVIKNMPEIEGREITTEDPAKYIVETCQAFDLVILGATAKPIDSDISFGPVADHVLSESPGAVIVVKTQKPMPIESPGEVIGHTAISILVDKWFAENTYSAEEFSDLDFLLKLKEKSGVSIALALPALNEEETVGNVISCIKHALHDEKPLLDEIVLIDSNSEDRTREIAQDLGVPVFIHQEVLPQYGERKGKGEALWKSLFVTHSDIILWIDTDIVNIHPRFIYGLVGPMLLNSRIKFVKGFYRRPIKVDDSLRASGGGRVTELTARPLINLFYPELSGIIQPLAGEYGGYRDVLELLPFYSGYGVEIGMLIDILGEMGLSSIAQVDLQERIHHNQPLESLSKMSFAIIQAVIHKLEKRFEHAFLEEMNKTMKLIRYGNQQYFLDIEEIAERERPPMASLPEYLTRQKKEISHHQIA